ncbi:MAG: filamentous hemagglutinin N-terminal domain-containing protein [Candidatus Marithrix sp.]
MSRFLILLIIIFSNYSVYAEIILDGSLGINRATLSGPDYNIGAELGRQSGSNLFHSFNTFNINSNESATFSSPDNVNNIISRITGGNPSNIDGLIRSDANMYLLNPYGIVFGENAQLDIQGSFHASTADYLKFQDGKIFDVHNLTDSILSIAPVESFGFLSNSILTVDSSELSVPIGENLSLIGGNLQVNNAFLEAASGQLNLIGVGSVQEINLDESLTTNGNIILDNSIVSTSGDQSGKIVIRGGKFEMYGGIIEANTETIDGEGIDIQVDELLIADGSLITAHTFDIGKSGGIKIKVKGIANFDGEDTLVFSLSETSGEIGDIDLEAGKLEFTNGISFGMETYGSGNSGNIKIRVKDGSLRLLNGAEITTLTFGTGNSGNIDIEVNDFIQLSGEASWHNGSIIAVNSEGIIDEAGDGGTIILKAKYLSLTDGGQIAASTFGPGDSGRILLQIADNINISGTDTLDYPSGIFTNAEISDAESGKNVGLAGNIILKTKILKINNKSAISAFTDGPQRGGNIDIQAQDIILNNEAYITAVASDNGDAGSIIINTDKLRLTNSFLQTIAEKADGGDIQINATNYISLVNSDITTSVNAENGTGGNINLQSEFIIQDYGRIIARAIGGTGGNIAISTTGIYKFAPEFASPIDASSKFGTDGIIDISSPDGNVSEQMVNLPTNAFDASNLLNTVCNSKLANNSSSFVVIVSEGVAYGFNDLLPSGPMLQPIANFLDNSSSQTTAQININNMRKQLPKLNKRCKL